MARSRAAPRRRCAPCAGSFTVGQSGRVDSRLNAPSFTGAYRRVGITYEHDKDSRAGDANVLSVELHGL